MASPHCTRPRGALGELVHRLRKERGLSLRQLGAAVGISHVVISRLEYSECRVSLDTLTKIAEVLQLPDPDALYYSVGRIPPDVREILKADPTLFAFLREAHAQGLDGRYLLSMIAIPKP